MKTVNLAGPKGKGESQSANGLCYGYFKVNSFDFGTLIQYSINLVRGTPKNWPL